MPRESKKQKARNVNTSLFGRSTVETGRALAHFKRSVPRANRDISRVLAFLDGRLEEKCAIPRGVSASHLLTMEKVLELALRPGVKVVEEAYCKHCKEPFPLVCPECGGDVKIDIPDAALEKNQIAALSKLMDKFFPNLAAVSTEININTTLTCIGAVVSETIIKYVPADKRIEAARRINEAIGEVVDKESSGGGTLGAEAS